MRAHTESDSKKHPEEIQLLAELEEDIFDWLEVDSNALDNEDWQLRLASQLLKLFSSFSEGINKFSEDDFRLGPSFIFDSRSPHPLVTPNRCFLQSTSQLLVLQSTKEALDVIFLDRRDEKDFLLNTQNYRPCHRFDKSSSENSFCLDGEVAALAQLSFCAQKIFIEFIETARELFQSDQESFLLVETEMLGFDSAENNLPASKGPAEIIITGSGLSGLLLFDQSDEQMGARTTTGLPKETASSRLTKKDKYAMKVEEMTISSACEMLRESIRREAENIKRAGVRAFETQDLDLAESLISKGRKVKSFQSLIEAALDEWTE